MINISLIVSRIPHAAAAAAAAARGDMLVMVIRYHTIRDAVLTSAQTLTRVSLIHRTARNRQLKSVKQEN